jgi:hypothetical protein
MSKKITALVLTVSMAITALPSSIYAATPVGNNASVKEVVSQGKQNLTIINNDLQNMIYTYDKDGCSYKVEEKFNEDLTNGYSTVYVLNDKNKYEIEETIKTTNENGIVKVIYNSNNGTETQALDLNEVKAKMKTNSSQGISLNSISDWTYNGTFNSSTRIARMTVSGVATVLAGIIGGTIKGKLGAQVSATITSVAITFVTDELPLLFYTQEVYCKWADGTYIKIAERVNTSVYSDSGRRSLVESFEVENWIDNWEYYE